MAGSSSGKAPLEQADQSGGAVGSAILLSTLN
jgi:hypothetical protein